ncbi:ATP-binding cassette sub-family G member 1 [Sarcoptes scabiei]|uniref:ATP-binding cassette sub-family G member 1 n=1 Tax=Sarcoptes scabiei TaxID=52283 RepID=A0A834VHH1_SARSC|nr:ATP-binding cassette sub-family G member 1 [Sarcoptes scabiei]
MREINFDRILENETTNENEATMSSRRNNFRLSPISSESKINEKNDSNCLMLNAFVSDSPSPPSIMTINRNIDYQSGRSERPELAYTLLSPCSNFKSSPKSSISVDYCDKIDDQIQSLVQENTKVPQILPSDQSKLKNGNEYFSNRASSNQSNAIKSNLNFDVYDETNNNGYSSNVFNHQIDSKIKTNSNDEAAISMNKIPFSNDPSKANLATKTIDDNRLELIWRHLSYTISKFSWKSFLKQKGDGRQQRLLLNSVNGSLKAGELLAIMGPSGAGKTTLIECISGRRRIGVSGEIIVNNCSKRTKLAYMTQEDTFMPCLTVFETLLFASKLRNYQRNNVCKVKLIDDNEKVYNATTFPDSDLIISLPDETYHRNLVNQIINKLGLNSCRNVRAENCSGGQQKRLCIALELIHSPSILILDEPTSGLDSVSCLQCVRLLRDLAHNPSQPMAIAASIHQPTALILQNFDRLYVLANDGRCIYDGPTDQLVSYLAKHNLTCPTYHNPADFVLEISSGDYGQDVVQKLIDVQDAQHQSCHLIQYSSSNDRNENDEPIDEEVRLWPEINNNVTSINKICQRSRKQVKRREFYKTILLWLRCMLLAFRDPTEYLLRFFSCISVILLNIILYNESDVGKADGCSQDSIMHLIETIRSDYERNRTFSITNSMLEGPGALAILNFGFIFFSMTFVAFLTMMPVILTFPMEVGVFYKEYFNGWYSFSSYFLAKNLTNLIPTIVLPIIFGSSTYFITHQIWEPWRFYYFILLLVLIALVADGVGIAVSALFVHNVNAASIFAATSQIPLLLFTGLLVQIDTLPKFLQPFTYLSYYRLFFEATVIVFYGYNRCPIPEPFDLKKIRKIIGDDVEEVMDCVWQNTNFFESNNNNPSLSNVFEKILTATENQNPSLIMRNFRLKDEDLNFLIFSLIVYVFVSRIFAYITLYRKANSKK